MQKTQVLEVSTVSGGGHRVTDGGSYESDDQQVFGWNEP